MASAGLGSDLSVLGLPVVSFEAVQDAAWGPRLPPPSLRRAASADQSVPFESHADAAAVAAAASAGVGPEFASDPALVRTWHDSRWPSAEGFRPKPGPEMDAANAWAERCTAALSGWVAAQEAGPDDAAGACAGEQAGGPDAGMLKGLLLAEAVFCRATCCAGDEAAAAAERAWQAAARRHAGRSGAAAGDEGRGGADEGPVPSPAPGAASPGAAAGAPPHRAAGPRSQLRAEAVSMCAASLLADLRAVMPRFGRTTALHSHVAAFVCGEVVACVPDGVAEGGLLELEAMTVLARVAESHRDWLRYLAAGALLRLVQGRPKGLRVHRAVLATLVDSLRGHPHPRLRAAADAAAQAALVLCWPPPPSLRHDAEMETALGHVRTATSLEGERAGMAGLLGALRAGGPHAGRFLGDAVHHCVATACDSPDSEVVLLALHSLRVLALSCWPRVRADGTLAAKLVAAAAVAAAQSTALQGSDADPIDEAGRAFAACSDGGTVGRLGPAASAVVEEAALLLAVVARAVGPAPVRAMLAKAQPPKDATPGARWLVAAVGAAAPAPDAASECWADA